MQDAANVLWRVYPWIPQLFLADILIAAAALSLARRRARRRAEPPAPSSR